MVTSRDIHEVVSNLSSDKARTREDGVKLLNIWLGGEMSITFCRFLSQKTAKLKLDEILNEASSSWTSLGSLLDNIFTAKCAWLSSQKNCMRRLRDTNVDQVCSIVISLMVHPDKCKHPQAREAFGALAETQQLLLDNQERDYILTQVHAAKEELKMKRKTQLKKDTASKIKSMVGESRFLIKFSDTHLLCTLGKHENIYEQSEEFQKEFRLKVRGILTDQEWRRRKMAMRISEEEGRLKKDEAEQKEMWNKKREHEEQWEGTRVKRVYDYLCYQWLKSSLYIYMIS